MKLESLLKRGRKLKCEVHNHDSQCLSEWNKHLHKLKLNGVWLIFKSGHNENVRLFGIPEGWDNIMRLCTICYTAAVLMALTMKKAKMCPKFEFLDVYVERVMDNYINTGVYRKKCYKNALLHRRSMHPQHIFSNIIKGQGMRISRLNATENGYKKEINVFKERLSKRGYKYSEIENGLQSIDLLRENRAAPYYSECTDIYNKQNSRILELKIPMFYTVPQSRCSDSCLLGYREAMKPGQPLCCFDCIICSEGSISNITDSTECIICSEETWPNREQDRCIPKLLEYISYEDPLGVSLAAVSLSSALSPLSVLLIFLKHHNTALVKANNGKLSYPLLLCLILCFLTTLLFIGQPNTLVCMLRQSFFGIIFAVCVSCVLAKTIMVVVAFRASKPQSSLKKWLGPRLPYSIVFFCTLVQVFMCTLWLIISPPFYQENKSMKSEKIILECNEGSTTAFWLMLAYLGMLASVSFLVAYLSRNLPDNFNEAKLITFSMLIFVSVWLSFIPAYLSTKGKYTVAVESFAIFSSSTGLQAFMFLPKCYIILLRPELNTRQYLMGKSNHEGHYKPQHHV
ncbi:vomeronasal type-2 receptor 26-like [Protopterus annectens]|uniref:vomeronasal type-2 receptor 26-like n=1 Tax=Protopterus annectens TaxID=7888 RepID=UPI001CFB4771|nr:vomeronasal type-2 receptor 26-like [Protopterus annectens]